MPTTTSKSAKTRVLSLLLCMLMLLSAFCTIPVSAADTVSVVDTTSGAKAGTGVGNGGVRFMLTDNGNSTVTLSYQVKGENLARVQCAALAFDRKVLSLVNTAGTTTLEVPVGSFTADTLIALDTPQYITAAAGWNTDTISAEYGIAKSGIGILILYAEPDTAVTYTDYTTVLSLTFAKLGTLTSSSVRLVTYEEQRTFAQSTKLLLCTGNAYATFGSLSGGDTLSDAVFAGNTAVTGDRGDDSIVSDEPWVNRFSDVSEDAPYYDAVAYVCKNNLFVGSSETTFEPDKPMTRATFATVLCRLAGQENAVLSGGTPTTEVFSDVGIGAWYTPYVMWAYENGIFIGRGDGTFGPDEEITHEQMYLVIERFTYDWGYHTKDGTNVSVSSIADADQISDWAVDAVKFAFANGILIADTNRCIRPKADAARWELAVLLESLSGFERTGTGEATLTEAMASGDVRDTCPPASDSMVRGAYQKIYEGLLSLTERISISAFRLNLEQFVAVYQEAAKQAEFFYVGNTFYYSYSEQTGEILSVTPTYTMRGAELVAAQNVYHEKLNAILEGVDSTWSDFEKVLYLHDYLALNFIYDETTGQYDTYTFLTTGRGVCQSYTMTLQALLMSLGIANSRVMSASMNHTWNLVKIGSSWYHVDVTWDDPQPDQWGQVQHTYFLKSDTYMNANAHSDWTCFDGYTCTDTRYDSTAFTKVHTPIVPIGDGVWCYIENESGILWKWNIRKGTRTKFYETGLKWVTGEGIWQSLYTGLARYEDMLLYNTQDAVMAYHISSGVAETIHTKTGDGVICGMMLETTDTGVYAVYQLRSTPAEKTGTTYRVQLDRLFTYSLAGAVRGYFTDSQVKITLLRNGTTCNTLTAARAGIYTETEYTFAFDGIRPGRYDLLVEKKGAFSYTVKNIDISADTDLRTLLGYAIPLISGDLSGDGVIDDGDAALLLSPNTFRRAPGKAVTAAADLNGDGMIDIVDYAILTDGDTFGKRKEDCSVNVAA